MNTKAYIKDFIPPLKSSDTVVRALQWMQAFNLNLLPVVDGIKYKGIVTDNDLKKIEDKAKSLEQQNQKLKDFKKSNDSCKDVKDLLDNVGED